MADTGDGSFPGLADLGAAHSEASQSTEDLNSGPAPRNEVHNSFQALLESSQSKGKSKVEGGALKKSQSTRNLAELSQSWKDPTIQSPLARRASNQEAPQSKEELKVSSDEVMNKSFGVNQGLASTAPRLKVGLVFDERMTTHKDPVDKEHPEQPARITRIFQKLQAEGLVGRCVKVPAREATDEELSCVHTEQHIRIMKAVSGQSYGKAGRLGLARRYNSVYFNEGSAKAALLAAGSVVEVASQVAKDELSSGVCVVRPPGHHAEADQAMGFCLYNNVAVAAHWLVHKLKLVKKVLIIDWDVHHGNGTQHMFWTDPNVLYFSVHRHDGGIFYPCSDDGDYNKVGEGNGLGFNLNVPWPFGGFGDADYKEAWDTVLLPIAKEYKPDIVLISAGFDAAEGDPLGGCELTPAGYSYMTHQLMDLADGRVVLALEGGYNLDSISASYAACTAVLLGDPPLPPPSESPSKAAISVCRKVRQELAPYWPVLDTIQGTEIPAIPEQLDSLDHLEQALNNVSVDQLKVHSGESDISVLNLPITVSAMEFTGVNETAIGEVSRFVGNNGSVEREVTGTGGSSRLQDSDVSTSTSEREVSKNIEIAAKQYVWYASYGSNMWRDRFMCYIYGGMVEGMFNACPGCRDSTEPTATESLEVPYRLFFGRTRTTTWGVGGVAFLDPREGEGNMHTKIRIYKITLEQFNDVVKQENRKSTNAITGHVLNHDDLRKLRTGNLLHDCMTILEGGWYGTVKYLGDHDGAPVLTFTCSLPDIEKFLKGKLPTNPPSEGYCHALVKGLQESFNMDEEAARAYVNGRATPMKKQ